MIFLFFFPIGGLGGGSRPQLENSFFLFFFIPLGLYHPLFNLSEKMKEHGYGSH